MAKKKLLAVAAAVASVAIVIPAFSASAATTASPKIGDQFQVGGQNVKMYANFEEFADGYMCGSKSTSDDWYIDPLYSCYNGNPAVADGKDHGLNMHIGDGLGADGSKGLAFSVRSTVATTGINDGAQFQANKVSDGVTNFEGATDVIFWVDCTANANKNVDVNCVWTEYDYNEDGTPYMAEDDKGVMQQQTSSWGLFPSVKNEYYTLEDGTSDWQTVTGLKGYAVTLPNTFKGYVRIPLKDFSVYWNTDDIDGKPDLKFVQRFGIFTGMMPSDASLDHVMVADNFGFVGTFQDVTETTNDGSGTTTSIVSKTTGTTQAVTTAAGTGTGTDAVTTASTATSNPTTGEVPITAAVVTAIVFAGVLVISKKRA